MLMFCVCALQSFEILANGRVRMQVHTRARKPASKQANERDRAFRRPHSYLLF